MSCPARSPIDYGFSQDYAGASCERTHQGMFPCALLSFRPLLRRHGVTLDEAETYTEWQGREAWRTRPQKMIHHQPRQNGSRAMRALLREAERSPQTDNRHPLRAVRFD
jgi:hypothetical protein